MSGTGGMRLIGGPNSPFVRKVLIALVEKGVLDRATLVRVVPPAAMMVVNPALLAENPLGKIPVLHIDGRVLWESDLICDYVDTAFGPPTLIPPAGAERWQTLQWNALGTGGMELLILWRFERLRDEGKQMPEFATACMAKVRAILAAMDRDLPELAAAPFGLGHIAWGCFLGYLDFRFDDLDWRSLWPAGISWYDEFLARPGGCLTLPEPQPDSRPDPAGDPARLKWS